ncbi:MAG: C10 family peptidase [Candidatus Cloacimonetes bacterium]|nr:C10 family peptidase [Candidatus Cloacimonadota bacterium]
MKRILLIVLLLTVMQLTANFISSETVGQAAERWFLERTGLSSDVLQITEIEEAGQTVLYGVNFTSGFVIIAADDVAVPVFGYSATGSFSLNDLPPQMEMLMNWQKAEIAASRATGEIADSAVEAEWERLLAEEFNPERDLRDVSPLLTTNWDQGQYFNALCPADPNGPAGHVWAGCVATAMAQVMKYWGYPETGVGSHSYYHPEYGTQSANFGTTTYNWAAMPNNVNSSNTSVATLLYHLGVSVDMDYSPDGSGAYSDDALDALVNYFQYQNTAQLLWKDDYTTTNWNSMLRTELDNSRPVYYRGQNYSSGHAFNIDGYQGTDYFHLNWGWSGSYNGYFFLDDMTPGSHSYNLEHAAIFNLQPALVPVITVLTPNGGESFGLGDTVNITWESEDTGSDVQIMLYDGNGLDTVLSSQTPDDGSFNWVIPAYFATGDLYRIKVVDSSDNSVYDYSDGYFSIYNPIIEQLEDVVITVSSALVYDGDTFTIDISTTELLAEWNLISYQFSLFYDESVLSYEGYTAGDFTGNILAYEGTPGEIEVGYANAMPISGAGFLVHLNFAAINPGTSDLDITDFRYNTYPINNVEPGSVFVDVYNPYADVIITAGSATGITGNPVTISVNTSELTTDMGAISFQFNLTFDNTLLSFDSYAMGEVPNPGNLLANESQPGIVTVAYANVMPLAGAGSLCDLTFIADNPGISPMVISDFRYNSNFLLPTSLISGEITIQSFQYPDWTVNPNAFEYNGSIWGRVELDDVPVTVTSGMLGCFVGDECRGVASLANGSIIDYTTPFGHIAFMPMIFSNETGGEILDFYYFDAATESIYNVAESMEFTADMTVGNGMDPFVFHASTINTVDISKDMVPGWNWISLNVIGEDMSVNSILSSISGDASYIKSQTQYATYYAGMGWFGTLNNFNNTSFYKLDVANNTTWEYTGIPVDLTENVYNLAQGWNWISYAPQLPEATSYALEGLNGAGGYIKSQTQYATYYAGMGWFGTLNNMMPLAGYMLDMNSVTQFNYPAPVTAVDIIEETPARVVVPDWDVNPHDYEYNGSIWGVVEINGVSCDDVNDWLGIFYGEECRGVASSDRGNVVDFTVPFGHIAFMPMIYSDATAGEILTLKYYDASSDLILDVTETLEFIADMVIGDGWDPFVMHAVNTGIEVDEISGINIVNCYPNPFNPSVTLSFELSASALVTLDIFNSKGQRVRSFRDELNSGDHQYIWNGSDERGNMQANGVYFYRLTTGERVFSGKMVMLK